MGFGSNFFFDIFPIMFSLTFFVVLGVSLVTVFQNIKQWNRNNHEPRLTVNATVVSKRNQYHRNGQNHVGHTQYYVTFQVESGDRMEFMVSGGDYGMLVEGDRGNLFFQGDRYLGFERE